MEAVVEALRRNCLRCDRSRASRCEEVVQLSAALCFVAAAMEKRGGEGSPCTLSAGAAMYFTAHCCYSGRQRNYRCSAAGNRGERGSRAFQYEWGAVAENRFGEKLKRLYP